MKPRLIPKAQLGCSSPSSFSYRGSQPTNKDTQSALRVLWSGIKRAATKIADWSDTEFTVPALDEMGHTIRQADGNILMRTSTPGRDAAAVAAGVAAPLAFSSAPVVGTVGTLAALPDATMDVANLIAYPSFSNAKSAVLDFPLKIIPDMPGRWDDALTILGTIDDIKSASNVEGMSAPKKQSGYTKDIKPKQQGKK